METNKEQIVFFQTELLRWHRESNERQHPWSEDNNPYKIWLSEIIMQQTRIEQGLPYYLRFVSKYPAVEDLAAAPDEEVFLLWQGLGYYNRCRNLLHTARVIARERQGRFPETYRELLQLKGVGDYTAAAIASFAFGLPHAVLDGNVFRVLSRFLGVSQPIDSADGKKLFQQLATDFLSEKEPAAYNQAIMDFGATVCTPKSPRCSTCPLRTRCIALEQGLVPVLPVKEKKLKVKERHFHYFLLHCNGKIYLHQRQGKDIWQNLFELYLIESRQPPEQSPQWQQLSPFVTKVQKKVYQSRQRLTHQLIITRFHVAVLKEIPAGLPPGLWVRPEEMAQYAYPKTVLQFLQREKD